MKKKIIILAISILLLLIILILIFWLFSNNQNNEPDIIIGHNINQVPLIIAKEKGYFKDYGINAKFVQFESSKYSTIAISANQIDIISGGPTSYFDPISKGVDLKIIAPYGVYPADIYVRPNGITKFQDLNNAKFGMREDSMYAFIFREILKENNLNLNIEYIDVDPAYTISALLDKKIIDFVIPKPTEKAMMISSGAVLLPEFKEKGYDNNKFLVSSIVVRGDYLKEHPENIDAFIDVYIKSQKYIKEHPDETVQIIMDVMNKDAQGSKVYSREEVIEILKLNTFALWYDSQVLDDLTKFANATGIIDKNLSLSDVYDNRYEEKLRKAQEEIYGPIK